MSLFPVLKRQKQTHVSEFEANMVYKASSRIGRPGLLHREMLSRIRKKKVFYVGCGDTHL